MTASLAPIIGIFKENVDENKCYLFDDIEVFLYLCTIELRTIAK